MASGTSFRYSEFLQTMPLRISHNSFSNSQIYFNFLVIKHMVTWEARGYQKRVGTWVFILNIKKFFRNVKDLKWHKEVFDS